MTTFNNILNLSLRYEHEFEVEAGFGDEYYYRYVDYGATSMLCCEKIPVIRHTPQGVKLNYYGQEKFVLSDPNGRRFAYATKEGALNSYIRRKEWQIKHAEATIVKAKERLITAKRLRDE